MKRWLLLSLAISIAAAATYALLTAPPVEVASSSAGPPIGKAAQPTAKPEAQESEAHNEIGEESREQLLEILRDADRQAGP